ncbi:MAG: nucleotidyltransferase [Bdellovibrionaceae bacterium]|nr:nucleotidyltransferase [Pseudobdellovibrionaceae bacterium]
MNTRMLLSSPWHLSPLEGNCVTNLNELLKLLLRNQIDFVLIGGFAGVVHGSSQVTRDLDIAMLLTPEQIENLRQCLKDIHPRHRMNPGFKPSFMDEPKITEGVKNIYLDTDLGILDILTEVTGVGDFERIRSDAVEISIFGFKCRVISPKDLIKAKETIGRDKDKAVVRELRKILKMHE